MNKFHRLPHTGLDLGIRYPLIAWTKGNILIDRFFKELMFGILKDHSNAEARRPCRLFFLPVFAMKADPIHENPSSCRREKTADQLHERRFARPRLACNRRKGSLCNRQRNIVQRRV